MKLLWGESRCSLRERESQAHPHVPWTQFNKVVELYDPDSSPTRLCEDFEHTALDDGEEEA